MIRDFRRGRRRYRQTSTKPAAAVQSLELRALPAGTVLVAFANNVAKITGDNLDNDVTVNVTASGISVTGNNGTQIKVGATIHPAGESVALPPPSPANAAVGFDIKLAGGTDTLTVNVDAALGARNLSKLKVDSGDGDDSVTISIGAGTTLNFSDAISIVTGKGVDDFLANIDGSVTAAKAMTVNTGAGQGEATLAVNGSLTVNAATTFTLGDDQDVLTLRGDGVVSFNGALTINAGKSADEVTVHISEGMTVTGLASITTADGDDQILLTHSQSTLDFQGGLTIDAGAGNDEVSISGSEGTLHVAGKDLIIKSGAGDDDVTLDEKLAIDTSLKITTDKGTDLVTLVTGTGTATGSPDAVANTIQKDVTIDTGDDHDQVNLQVGFATSLAIASAGKAGLKILTGAGPDEVLLLHANAVVTSSKGIMIDTGAGAGQVTLVGGQLNVTGALKISTGELDSMVSISETLAVTGDVGITNGTGNDTVELAFGNGAETNPVNTIGSLTLQTGNGADNVTVENTGSVKVVLSAAPKSTGIVSINTGNGADQVELTASADFTIDKDLTVNTGAGADAVHVEAASGSITVNGSETVNLGADDDCFTQGTATALAPFRPGSPEPTGEATFQVGLNLSVIGGAGNDFIGLAGFQVGKDPATVGAALPASLTTIDGGAGNDSAELSSVTLRDLKLIAGANDDTIDVDDLTLRGTTNADVGAGDDRLALRGTTAFNDNVTLLGGAGADQLGVGANVTVAATKKVKVDGGANGMVGMNSSSSFAGALNPAPVNITDGTVDSSAIANAVASLFQNCLAQF